MTGHFIVCGLGHLGYRIVDLLLRLGESVTVITQGGREEWLAELEARGTRLVRGDARNAGRLREAGIERARALIGSIKDDLTSIQVAVDARQLRPDLPLVLRLFDQQLARQLEKTFGIRGLGMSFLAAPAFAAAAAGEHQIASLTLDGQAFVIFGLDVEAGSSLLGLTAAQIEERHHVAVLDQAGTRLTLLARRADAAALFGPRSSEPPPPPPPRRPPWRRLAVIKEAWRNAPLPLRTLFVVLNLLIALSVFVFRFGMGLSFVDALYFVVTTVTTVGYGDYNLHDNGPALKLYGALVMVFGSATIATLYSILTDFVVSTRFEQLAGRHRVPDGNPIVVVGLGNVGFRVLEELRRAGAPAVVIERDADGPFVQAAGAHVPVILGDGRLPEILQRAGVARAHAVIAVTGDDAANLGVALAVREIHPRARTVVRVFDADFAAKVQPSLGLSAALSASLTAAPTFVAAALSPDVLGAVVDGRRFLMLVARTIPSDLAGLRPSDLPDSRTLPIVLRPQTGSASDVSAARHRPLAAGERVITLDSRPLL